MKMRVGAALLITALISVSSIQVLADTSSKLIVNGTLIKLDTPPEIINGRAMAPVRAIAENIGATVGWEANYRQISLYTHDRYVLLRIGDPNMYYGTFSSDGFGTVSYNAQLVYILEAPPVISKGRALVPLRAIAEGLGAEVNWDPATSAVYINSPGMTPTPQPASPTPTPAPASDARYFQEISASQAQRWYDIGAPYILYYYSHLSETSMAVLQWVQQAAAKENLMVYGVDTDSGVFNNTGGALSFIWNYMDRNSNYTKPALFFVVRSGSVTPLIQPRDINSINFCMTAFYYNVTLNNPTINDNNLPMRIPDLRPINVSAYWREITRDAAIAKYNNNDRFIYICYNSRNAECSALMPMLWLAVEKSQATVYGTDFADITGDINWFGKEALNGRQIYAFPTVYFVTGRDSIPYGSVQPKNILEMMNAFYNFSH